MFYPILMCTVAGLATTLGGIMVVSKGGISKNKMGFFQGFAAGVMLVVSLFDLMPYSFNNYFTYMRAVDALKASTSLLFIGWVIGHLLTALVVEKPKKDESADSVLTAKRLAVITTAVMVLHNLPEGMLTMFTASSDMQMGLRMTLAIAMHNLPEGMAVASPVLYVTKSPAKAVQRAFLAGMAEPLGGVLAYFLLKDFISLGFINGLMPIIAGIMCQASICELIPSGIQISNTKHTIRGIIVGAVIMSVGILLI